MRVRYLLSICCGLTLLAAGPAAHAIELANAGFEKANLSGWDTFGGGWRTSGWAGDQFADFHSGKLGCVCDVDARRTNEWRGISQNVPVQAGARYSGGVWIRTFGIRTSASYFEVQFLDGAGAVLEHFQSVPVQQDQPFTFAGVEGVEAPKGAVSARIRGIVRVTGKPSMTPEFHVFDDFAFGTMFEMRDLKK